jgi:protoheme IX farnesyltransferase
MSAIASYIELTKPKIALMVLLTTLIGYYLGAEGIDSYLNLFFVMLGTALVGGGASVLNQYLERDTDALMERTRNRPLPSGVVAPQVALYMGTAMCVGGVFQLLWCVNIFAAFLALLSAFLYVLVYTPMKRFTWLNTSVGAIPGAIPPMIGWAGATNDIGAGAWLLFLILYLWQHPHFFAIAWMWRSDYKRGGLKMLPTVENGEARTIRQGIFFSILLIPASLLPTIVDLSGWIYFFGALALGLVMLASDIVFSIRRTDEAARLVLRTSLVYLPVLLLLFIADARL